MEKMRVLEANIMKGDIKFPPGLSKEAQSLIVRLLHPDSNSRPRTEEILKDAWFVKNG